MTGEFYQISSGLRIQPPHKNKVEGRNQRLLMIASYMLNGGNSLGFYYKGGINIVVRILNSRITSAAQVKDPALQASHA